MCMTKTELNKVVEELRSLKTLKNETEQQIRQLESGIIEFLNETAEYETVDKNGKPIKQYIGTDYKATYSTQTRENVKKDEVKKYLTDKEYEKCITRSTFGVLRVQESASGKGGETHPTPQQRRFLYGRFNTYFQSRSKSEVQNG